MRELKARSIRLPTLALDAPGADAAAAVAAMKAGAADFLVALDDELLSHRSRAPLESAMGRRGLLREMKRRAPKSARLTTREREVLVGLLEGGTNKIIGQKLGITPPHR